MALQPLGSLLVGWLQTPGMTSHTVAAPIAWESADLVVADSILEAKSLITPP